MATRDLDLEEELFFPLEEPLDQTVSPFSGRAMVPHTPKRIPKSILREKKRSNTNIKEAPTTTAGAGAATAAKPDKPSAPCVEEVPTEASTSGLWVREYPLPDWHRQLRLKDGVRDSTKDVPGLDSLMQIRSAVQSCEKLRLADSAPPYEDIKMALEAVRSAVHQAERETVNDKALKRCKILEPDPKVNGLVTIFATKPESKQQFRYPSDIRADALSLYRKWIRLDCNPDLFRGLIFKFAEGGRKRKSAVLDENYPNKINAKYFGAGDLVNGQWWPNRLAMLRDGAHGAPVAGICGKFPDGTYSIIVSGAYLEDKDNGEELLYCGTPGYKKKETKDTTLLFRSQVNGNPIRVIRTSRLPVDNPYRPIVGCRYDGLYRVVSRELLDSEKAHFRFRLLRMPGEEPIRCEGHEARPTKYEVAAYYKHQHLRSA